MQNESKALSTEIGGTVGAGGVATAADEAGVRVAAEQLLMVDIERLVPYANNARRHSKRQIRQIRASLREFGFVTPVIIDFEYNIIAGHGRVLAAREEGLGQVPCVLVSNLTEAQRQAYILADNRLAETSDWDVRALRMEMGALEKLSFDTGIIGFDAADMQAISMGTFGQAGKPGGDAAGQNGIGADKTVDVEGYSRAAPGQGGTEPQGVGTAPQSGVDGGHDGEETEEYRQFVEKFKPRKTTDDCYTPENVYACVRDWAVEHYDLEGSEIVRPFWPGGDYQSLEYPANCVVIDNPPFSILSDICRWYQERNIRFFLFAPSLTLFSTAAGSCGYLPCGVTVTYENGADVATSFVTNLGRWKIEISPELYRLVTDENSRNLAEGRAELPGYIYPGEVLTSAIYRLAKYGQALRLETKDVHFIRTLDAQREQGKAIFGAGFLLSERAAAERAAAERAAAERAAAERAAAERAAAEHWMLSERERQLVAGLGGNDGIGR